jgi:hypothetical protein
MKTAIVLLYGLYAPQREKYGRYLREVVSDSKKEGVGRLILCGGYTDPKKPEVSEAGSVKDFLEDLGVDREIVLEDKSITTNQNLELAAGLIDEDGELIVYCDEARKAKVIWLALHFFLGLPQQEIYKVVLNYFSDERIGGDFECSNLTVKGFDVGSEKDDILGQTYASILDVLAAYEEELNDLDLKKRKEKFGIS